MEKGLFEGAAPKSSKKFEDGSQRFYRFIEDDDKVIANVNTDENKTLRHFIFQYYYSTCVKIL